MKCQTELGRAPAKVNLHLNVYGKRPDGYHELISVFQKISLADEILMKVYHDDSSITIPEAYVTGLENLVEKGHDSMTKAIGFWCRRFNIPIRVEIVINKRIPSGSGLGGASSDAAFVLLVLNQLFFKQVDQDYMSAVALEVGADVPFFLSGAHAAVVEGIGDVITPLAKPKNFFGYVLLPKKSVATSSAYSRLDEIGLCTRVLDGAELANMYSSPIGTWRFANDFARVTLPPEVRVPDNAFYSLTGSGSAGIMLNSVFPPFAADFDGQVFPVLLL
ncbi:MAG: 4-(cytidine 5'-diphospho)-2-C-methyl-D-erythritol kinase [Sphaerochaetaceae bacterium]|jgi:4-diphosphocytidyl-2-C-methyl-D-erythritol kinase|nr:4-(cytidine 5'-diphospho)-2-C-methyl-D-erythritol kinase [Sphaerochaetaceae bacterium]NLY07309.1 4-(cytidine 5'-diphospho)-2-C-methyl-D-erythritol kinase [Spirochaetales bacterium]